MTKFTKGNWVIDKIYSSMLYITANGHGICEVDSDSLYDVIEVSPTAEQMANAHLIVQSKNMYKMLQDIKLVLIEVGNGESIETKNIEQLLANARGE